MTNFIKYGDNTIEYTLFYATRKTLEIAVHSDGNVIVKAPMTTTLQEIEKRMIKKAQWILKQKTYFNQFSPRKETKKYLSGETHLYMGRQYRLKIEYGNTTGVKLSRGFFTISCTTGSSWRTVKKEMEKWYLQKADIQFNASLDRCWSSFENLKVSKPKIKMRQMKTRWGSFSEKSGITVNTELIKASKKCIDYVVTHELCHIKHHNHGKEFYALLEEIIPDWKKVKHKLELHLS